MNELVSICIPTYNGAKYLQEALDSVKAQSYPNIEVVISDDASSDNTLKICEKFKREVNFPVKIINHIPSGIGANWNNTITHSKGKYLKFLFQDDILAPRCIETMLTYLQSKNLEFVAAKRIIINNRSEKVESGLWFERYGDLQQMAGFSVNRFRVLSKYTIKNLNLGFIYSSNMIGEPCVTLFTRKLYQRIGPFNTSLQQSLDYEYWIRVLGRYKIGIIEEKLVKFRIHEEQASHLNSLGKINEVLFIQKSFSKVLLFYTNIHIIKSYYIEKLPFLKRIILFKKKLCSQKIF